MALIEALRQEQLAIALEQTGLGSAGPAAVAASIRWHQVVLARQQARYWGESA